MGSYGAAVTGDQGANHMYWVYGMGYATGLEMGGGESWWRGGFAYGAGGESVQEFEVGLE